MLFRSIFFYKVASRKIHSFISGRILETKVSGRMAASLAKCVVLARPERGLQTFLPNIVDEINREYNDAILLKSIFPQMP